MIGDSIYNLIKKLYDIPRSLTGDGVRKTLNIIKNDFLPELIIHEVPSGSKVGDWIIPDEWNVTSAFIEDLKENKIINFEENNLHLVGYSEPIDKIIDLEELNKNLFSLEEMPNAIPYVTSYYKKSWGFCLSHNQRLKLKDEKYHVLIDSSLKKGNLTYEDLVIEGKIKDEIFISTYICHPSMANNELSGPALSVELAKWISKRDNRYTYRFSFTPETIGSITYIHKNEKALSRIYAAFNLTCVGDNKSFSFLPSRTGETITDKIARHCIKNQKNSYTEYSFIKDRGSDERQYCSPGVDLPMVSIMKSKYEEYPEYHTSLDDLNFISKEGLEDSFNIHTECIEILEENFIYKSKIKGEPFLSKRGKNYQIVGGKKNIKSLDAKKILDLIICCDGTKDIVDIADSLDSYALDLIPFFNFLKKEGLVEVV